MGTTLFKDAKSPDDYAQVENEFKQAADLKLYQQFKLSEADARTAQDKIYEVEAKQAKANDPAAKERERIAEGTKEVRQAQLEFAPLIQKLDGGVFIGQGSYATIVYKSKIHFRRNAETGLLECATSDLTIQSKDPKDPVTGQWTKEDVTFIGVNPTSGTDFTGCSIGEYKASTDGRTISSLDYGGSVVVTYYRQ
jgi:hypothetical protein